MEIKEMIKLMSEKQLRNALFSISKGVDLNKAIDEAFYDLKELYKRYCIHKDEYNSVLANGWYWGDCKDCILRDIEWQVPETPIIRDICFAIWHDEMLK